MLSRLSLFRQQRSNIITLVRQASSAIERPELLIVAPFIRFKLPVIARYSYEGEFDNSDMDELANEMFPENSTNNMMRIVMLLNRRVHEYEASGDAKKMASTLEQLLELQPRSDGGFSNYDETHLLQRLCNCYMTIRDYPLAKKRLERLSVLTPESYEGLNSDGALADQAREVAAIDTDSGIASANMGDNGLAFEKFLLAHENTTELDSEELTAMSLANLGVQGQPAMLSEAYEMFKSTHGAEHPFTILTAKNLGLRPVEATTPRP